MKYYIKTLKLLLSASVFIGVMATSNVAKAQCAQCVAAVETNRQAGNEGLAKGLNKGNKKFRKKDIALNVCSEKLHLN